VIETGETLPPIGQRGSRKMIGHRSAEDDPAGLRGLPAIGPSVGGAIAGTDPVRALMAKQNRRRR
jgi:hypothetical protein